jgi:hypothetical protein
VFIIAPATERWRDQPFCIQRQTMAQHRQIAAPAYLVALAFLLIPPFDAFMQVLPLRVHDPRWRFGFFGLESNALMLPMAGLLIAFMTAVFFEHRRFQKVLGILSTIAAVAVIVALGVFALDALQVRPEVKPAAQLAFRVASMTAALKSILGIITLIGFSYAALRAPKVAKVAKASRAGGLIVTAKPSNTIAAGRPEVAAIEAGSGSDKPNTTVLTGRPAAVTVEAESESDAR